MTSKEQSEYGLDETINRLKEGAYNDETLESGWHHLKALQAENERLKHPPSRSRVKLALELFESEYVGQDSFALWTWAWDKSGQEAG